MVDPAVMAERRARRAELADEGLADRAATAEELAEKLRHRTDELERDLAAAARERDDLLGRLRSRERALVTVQQQEESERRRRHEVEVESDADRRRLEQEVSDLRVRVSAAETWTAELSAELTQTRNALDATRRDLEDERAARARLERGTEDQDAMALALEARRAEMAGEVAALREQATALADRLTEEERVRSEAQRGLVAERERAEAQITLLEHELDRRAEIHDAVLAQLRGLGGEVARVRDGVAGDVERRAATERTLSEVAATARRLRGELDELEQARDAAAGELLAAQRALLVRDETLTQARAEVGAVRADLEAVLVDTNRQADALAATQRELTDAQAALATTQQALTDSRRTLTGSQQALVATRQELEGSQQALAGNEQALSEARRTVEALRQETATRHTENDRLSRLVADGVAERELALAEQQRGFDAQIQGFEHTVSDLRGRLAAAAQEFDARLGEEHAAAQAARVELATQQEAFTAEHQRLHRANAQLEASRAQLAAELDEARATIAVERERADAGEALAAHVTGDRDRLAAELARRDALDEHVRGTLQGLRGELDGLRVQSDARDAREAAVERLVADLVETARELREGFDRELREVRGQLERGAQADLDAAEGRLSAMRVHLEGSVDQLNGELLREQAARRAAEESLGAERDRVEAAGLAAVDAAVARDDLARELQSRLAAEEEARRALAAAEQELALLRRTTPPSRDDALAVVESLTRAARRLREESDLVETPEAQAGGAAEVAATPDVGLAVVPAPEAEPEAVPAPVADVAEAPAADKPVAPEPVEAPEAPVAPVPAVPERRSVFAPRTAAALAAPDATLRTEAVPVRPRVVAPEDRVATPWLTPALQRLAADDARLGVAALVTLLPSLGSIATKDLKCDVTVRGSGTWRVALAPGTAEVATLTRTSGDPDVTLVGEVGALAPLVAGGAHRRLPGVDVIGRRRRLRRLLKDRRDPVSLADLHAANVVPSASVLLELLSRGVAPEWVAATDVVDFAVSGEYGGTWRVTAAPGASPTVTVPGPADPKPDATVHIADVAILALLAALPLPPGERLLIGGDVDAATAVTGLFGRAQGLTAVPA